MRKLTVKIKRPTYTEIKRDRETADYVARLLKVREEKGLDAAIEMIAERGREMEGKW